MGMPHLHILHPPEDRLPGITSWLAELVQMLGGQAEWDGCQFHRLVYDDQASFNVPTAYGNVCGALGPVILIHKVRALVRERFTAMLQRKVVVYTVRAGCAEDIWEICETARLEYEGGEPTLPLLEVFAHLILKKLKRMGKWGGSNNKNFLWSEHLPKGGFPKDIVDSSEIINTADALVRAGILQAKPSKGQRKYALGDKAVVQPILDDRSFSAHPRLSKFFSRVRRRESVRAIDYRNRP